MEGTLAEVRMFAGNFSPRGWQYCNGQLLSIAQWTAVFALVGTTYGGDGQTTFGMPDFRGRVARGAQNSTGPGLPTVDLGEMSGSSTTTVLSVNFPAHNHQVTGNLSTPCLNDDGNKTTPGGNFMASLLPNKRFSTVSDGVMGNIPVNLPTSGAGSSQPISIMQPYLGISYIICVEGIFPSRD